MKIGLVTTALTAALLVSYPAAAQAPAKPAAPPATAAPTHVTVTKDYIDQDVAGGQVVTFPGDELPGDLNDPYGGLVRSPPRVLRQGLIRPRMNFVPELLKTVENL